MGTPDVLAIVATVCTLALTTTFGKKYMRSFFSDTSNICSIILDGKGAVLYKNDSYTA